MGCYTGHYVRIAQICQWQTNTAQAAKKIELNNNMFHILASFFGCLLSLCRVIYGVQNVISQEIMMVS
jgi:hypothetical protein